MSAPSFQSLSPQDPSRVVGEFPSQSAAEVEQAAALARKAQVEWISLGAAGRSAALAAAATELRARAAEVADLIVAEVGKPITEAKGEVSRTVSILDYYAQAGFLNVGSTYPPSLGGVLYTERRPHGVAGLITPWNFPLAIPMWKAAPALIAGNAVLLKPSPDATACASIIVEIVSRHAPDHLATMVTGAAEVGAAVLDHADVVSFTGSANVGRQVAVAAARRGIPVQCEMGGQNAAIVLNDADAERTAASIAGAAMGYAGQKCTATRRIIVVGEHPEFLEALSSAVDALAPADPAAATTVVGPVINETARDAVDAAIARGVADGGRRIGHDPRVDSSGWYVPPTVLEGLPPDHALCREETFGPLAVVLHAPSIVAAVELANSVRYGLVTSVHGRDLDQVLTAVKRLDTGLIKVNAPTTGVDFYAPFGGEKDSSYGPREQGTAALDFYSSTRTVTMAPHT